MYLAAERGHTETETFRSYNTFSSGENEAGNKQSCGPLYRLNDETLAGGQSIPLAVEEDTLVVLLPLVGGIVTTGAEENENSVEAGQLQLHYKQAGECIEISNPYNEELVNYLQLCLCCKGIQPKHPLTLYFDIKTAPNKLVELFTVMQKDKLVAKACLGKFDGRAEATYRLLSEQNGVMVFVVQGAFEVENRLLESRDGLALWNTATVEMEALSNEGIVLLLEIQLRGLD
jgi:quercetin 2,3-dioxygenase